MSETRLLDAIVGFGRRLRDADVQIGTSQIVTFGDAVAQIDPTDLRDLYWSGRACLLTRPDDRDAYDAAFAEWFLAGDLYEVRLVAAGAPPNAKNFEIDLGALSGAGSPRTDEDAAGAIASEIEILRHKDFAACTPEDLDRIRELMTEIKLATPTRKLRRSDPAPRGRRPDMRRTLRHAARRGGAVGPMRWRRARVGRRPLVLLLDVSGSMAGYSRVLVQFAHAAARGRDDVEIFAFGTRLTRISDALARRDPDAALEQAAARVVDWDGGTRIGDAVATYITRWGRRVGMRGAVVVICSDGLERGDPDRLADAMARLTRLAKRIIWVNPLKGDDAFEPTTRGMQAALPHIDELVSGHDLASLEDLAGLVRALP